jgi:hypothetical protein
MNPKDFVGQSSLWTYGIDADEQRRGMHTN